jgi:hypothetical protein
MTRVKALGPNGIVLDFIFLMGNNRKRF